MKLSLGLCVIFTLLLSFYGVQSHVIKREADDDSSADKPPGTGGPQTANLQRFLQGVIEFSSNIPIIGGIAKKGAEYLAFIIVHVEMMTNGSIGRILGGAFPCRINFDGVHCSGITKNGGISQLVLNGIDSMPRLLMPPYVKLVIKFAIKGLINPTVDVLLGGQPRLNTS